MAELSGVIRPKDYIVGINGADLTVVTFDQAMTMIRTATWPKTLHFLRDSYAQNTKIFIESWVHAYYQSLNRRRRRYIELSADRISFRKPAPGGAVYFSSL
jgi:C-terminal processing protease CtpA/Prc